MADNQEFNLTKRVLSNKFANSAINSSFKNLAKSEEHIDDTKIKNMYDDLFYRIPKTGRDSHENIIEQSYEYIRANVISNIENKIDKTTNDIKTKEAELNRKEDQLMVEEHPLYENGAILVQGVGGQPDPVVSTKWIMQEKRKRAFEGTLADALFVAVKKALSLPLGVNDGRYFLSAQELNALDNGKPITRYADLNLTGRALIPTEEIEEQEGYSDWIEVNFECAGNEVSDFVGGVTNPDDPLDYTSLQFYLNEDACTIKYIFDEKTTDGEGPVVLTETINAGESKIIRILRNSLSANNNIPNMSPYWDENVPENIVYNGTDISNYTREWGPYKPDGDFRSIVYAEGRLFSSIQPNDFITEVLQESIDTSRKIFNGLPSQATGAWNEDPNIVLIDNPDYPGQELSDYGTRMIYPKGSGMWGGLNQNDYLQDDVFNNPSNVYYKDNFPIYPYFRVYGQPIFRYGNMWLVLLNAVAEQHLIIHRHVWFYVIGGKELNDNAEYYEGEYFQLTRKKAQDRLGLVMDYVDNTQTINGMRWDTWYAREERVYQSGFIGLKDFQTNEYTGEGNVYNQHSNYEYLGFPG